jgi:hypothetical protein
MSSVDLIVLVFSFGLLFHRISALVRILFVFPSSDTDEFILSVDLVSQ